MAKVMMHRHSCKGVMLVIHQLPCPGRQQALWQGSLGWLEHQLPRIGMQQAPDGSQACWNSEDSCQDQGVMLDWSQVKKHKAM